MKRAALLSAILHVVVVLFAWLGLPKLMLTPPEIERPIIVDLVQIGEKTNPPPAPVEQLKQDQPAPEPPKPEPPKPEPPKPAPPPPPPAPAPPPPPVTAAEPLPAPKPKEKPPEPKPEPKPEAPKPSPLAEVKPKPRPEPPPDDFANVLKTVEKLKNQPPPDEFDKMLKKLSQPPPQTQQQAQAQPLKPATQAGSPASNLNEKFTISEEDFIRRHIQKNWNPPVGAKEAVVVTMSFTIRPDGTFYDLRYENERASDPLWRSFADSARRALLLSSPIPLPPGKVRADERYVFNFDPREMMGYSSKAR
jgi:outer membrane biosynthesis protein TonB